MEEDLTKEEKEELFLDSDENNEPSFSGSRWKHIIKSK